MSMNAAIKSMFAMWMQNAQTPMALITVPVRMDTLGMDNHVTVHAMTLDINNWMSNQEHVQ